jgi:hypothetical protein
MTTYRERTKPWESRTAFKKDAPRQEQKKTYSTRTERISEWRDWFDNNNDWGWTSMTSNPVKDPLKIDDSIPTEQFSSWDDLQKGDEIIWYDEKGVDKKYHLIFEKYGSVVEARDKNGALGCYSSYIYPHKGWVTLGNPDRKIGWKKVVTELQYNPEQQGDTEDDL